MTNLLTLRSLIEKEIRQDGLFSIRAVTKMNEMPLFEEHGETGCTISCLLAWISAGFEDLADEGNTIVDHYWAQLRQLENQQPFYRRASLGLRQRIRENGSFSLEWYGMGTLGKAKRPVAKVHIHKSRGRMSYPIKTLMRRQPGWILDLVQQTEAGLTDIRVRQNRLIRIRDALGDYLRIDGGPAVTGSRLIEAYRIGDDLNIQPARTLQ